MLTPPPYPPPLLSSSLALATPQAALGRAIEDSPTGLTSADGDTASVETACERVIVSHEWGDQGGLSALLGGEGLFSVLILFSGPTGRQTSLAAYLRRLGCWVEEVDIRIDPAGHDLTRVEVRNHYLRRIAAGVYDAVFAAPPCSSFSPALEPQLRSVSSPEGIEPVPPEWRQYLDKHNTLADFAAAALKLARSHGLLWLMENPADRSKPPAFWEAKKGYGNIWIMPSMVALRSLGACSEAT